MKYFTVSQMYYAETEQSRSRFLAHLVPLADFDDCLSQLRQEHKKANHHVTAFRKMLPNLQIQEIGRDDGEPSGTSGVPVLKVLIGEGLMDVGVIVTRYFGGVKLGTGGLARAYSGAARLALENADLVPWLQLEQRALSVPFSEMSNAECSINQLGLVIIKRDFHENGCTLTAEGTQEMFKLFASQVQLS